MMLADKLQKKLDLRGYVFADAAVLLKKFFLVGGLISVFWSVLFAELKYRSENIVLPWYVVLIFSLVCVSVPVCNILFGKDEYELTCFKETLQIHSFCILLGEYGVLGMEESVKWLTKISDKYQAVLRNLQLHLATGRGAEWETVTGGGCNKYVENRNLKVMWTRIFEHIKELDTLGNSRPKELFKSQAEYAEKICFEQIKRLWQRRIFICKLIAYLPVFCTVIFYMIYPFVLEGVRLLNTYSEEMKSLGLY